MARFPIVPSRGRRLLSLVRSGEAHPSAAAAASYNKAPTSYWIYTAEASAYLYQIGICVPTPAASSRPLRRSYAGSTTSAATRAQSEAVVSASCPAPSSSASGGWGFLPLAAAAALGACVGGAFATYGPRGMGAQIYEDEDEAAYMNLPYRVTDVSGRTAILMPSFDDIDDYFAGNISHGGLLLVRPIHRFQGKIGYTTCEGLKLVHPVLHLQGNAHKSAVKCFELRGVSYRLPKPQMFKDLHRKMRVAHGKFFANDVRNRIKETLKKAGSLALMQLKIESEFVLYLLEQRLIAAGGDYLAGGLVILLTGFLSWLKGTPFQERFVIEQPEDHLAHLTLKLLKEHAENTELTILLGDGAVLSHEIMKHVVTNQETTDAVYL